ncbi:biotin--[acetyl-CoA-carboxylase] ligase [Moheibacter sp.]|uniref:biotin--[acetyl-CoA-carboxylase] ligase n=1 Tax=Moheibacter sp. TaxID=1965316 RepID=UPI003C78A65C
MEIYHFESLPSTNSKLLELSKKNAKSWTVVSTFEQTAGKGYSGNQWTSEPNKNIAVSVLIKSELNYSELIYFNQWLCNTVAEYLKRFSDEVYVKWPNDIIIHNKKVCGILIETHRSESQLNIISGIGVNVNQTDFKLLPKAGSLATQTGKEFDLEEILSDLLTELVSSYRQIENREWENIFSNYNQNLFRLNQASEFMIKEEEFEAIIRGVDESGQLILENAAGELMKYPHKSIELIY